MWIKVGNKTINMDNVAMVTDKIDESGLVWIEFNTADENGALSCQSLEDDEAQDFLCALSTYCSPIDANGLAADMAKPEEPREVGTIHPSPVDSDIPF